ncbi:hypothetical protein GCM10007940_28360 [Portibacter lacus]|uniref:Uncharacterized protein n=2 Tax=Portibacter lacus TaxID=1099794 RepID=A0AA37WDV8_9BACT|nr:hypothetical protein GCM10007940_28360 [Portibacter lacus]
MIGILLALQVNNWNEERKLRLEELELLVSLKSDLEDNKSELERTISNFKTGAERNRKILKYIEEDLAYDNQLDTSFARINTWKTPYFRNSTYETLKTKGINIIERDDLKNKIIKIYDYDFFNLVNDWDRTLWLYAESISYPLTNKTVKPDLITYLARPNNFENLKSNTEFKNMLLWLTYNKEVSIPYLQSIKNKVTELIDDIDDEIIKNKK